MRREEEDSVVAEIRATRDEMAASFGNDPVAIIDYVLEIQRKSGEDYVQPPRRGKPNAAFRSRNRKPRK